MKQSDINQLNEAISSGKAVVAYYTASWCGPCKSFSPIMEVVAEHFKDRVDVHKIAIESAEDSAHFGVRSVPTVAYYKGGRKITSKAGTVTESQLRENFTELANG